MNGPDVLEFDGERFLPGLGGAIEVEHWHRYRWAADAVRGRDVLDIACGEGYGAALLAGHARSVVGVDISEAAVAHAGSRYGAHANLRFLRGSCDAIPLPDAAVDVVVSFETIEHHDRHAEMMDEIARVLRPGGLLVISSPDRANYSDRTGYRNPFHVRELYRAEFETLLRSRFAEVALFGQRVVWGSLLVAEGAPGAWRSLRRDDGGETQSDGLMEPLYWVALASNGPLPALPAGLFECPPADPRPRLESLVAQREQLIGQRDRELAAAVDRAGRIEQRMLAAEALVAERDAMLEAVRGRAELAERVVAERDAVLEALQARAEHAERVVAERDAWIQERDRLIGELRERVAERDAWLEARQREILRLDALAVERERLVQERDRWLLERDRLIGELRERVAERDAWLEARQREILRLDALAVERERLVQERDAWLAQRDDHIRHLERLVADREALLESERGAHEASRRRHAEERSGMQSAIGELQSQLADRDARIARMMGWRWWLARPWNALRALVARSTGS